MAAVPAAVEVVIPTHGRYELTASCLSHLAAQTVAHRVIVIDNASHDDTVERLRTEWPAVEVVALERNSGFSFACNAGVDSGEAPFVVLLNNDVDVKPNFLARLLSPLEDDPSLGSVAPLLLRPGEEEIDSVGLASDVTLAGFPRLRGRPAACSREPLPVLTGPTGAAGAYRRAAWEQVGGLDERIMSYMEDLDLALRLRAANWGSATAPGAVAVHLGSASYGHRSARQRRLGAHSRGYLLRRYRVLHGPHAARTLLTELTVTAGDMLVSRDLESPRGRLCGWRAAADLAPRALPAGAVDHSIGLRASLMLRRGIYRN
jgi:N-acetylglucosaminyl-diphospho-decaprenol L-rhamnosyltransferase